MSVTFELAGQVYIAFNGGPHYALTPAVSIFLSCETQQEVDTYWEKLLAGGGKEQPCGWLVDRFGLSWQIIPTVLEKLLFHADRDKAKRATNAMMQMKKIDIARLVEAAGPP